MRRGGSRRLTVRSNAIRTTQSVDETTQPISATPEYRLCCGVGLPTENLLTEVRSGIWRRVEQKEIFRKAEIPHGKPDKLTQMQLHLCPWNGKFGCPSLACGGRCCSKRQRVVVLFEWEVCLSWMWCLMPRASAGLVCFRMGSLGVRYKGGVPAQTTYQCSKTWSCQYCVVE